MCLKHLQNCGVCGPQIQVWKKTICSIFLCMVCVHTYMCIYILKKKACIYIVNLQQDPLFSTVYHHISHLLRWPYQGLKWIAASRASSFFDIHPKPPPLCGMTPLLATPHRSPPFHLVTCLVPLLPTCGHSLTSPDRLRLDGS